MVPLCKCIVLILLISGVVADLASDLRSKAAAASLQRKDRAALREKEMEKFREREKKNTEMLDKARIKMKDARETAAKLQGRRSRKRPSILSESEDIDTEILDKWKKPTEEELLEKQEKENAQWGLVGASAQSEAARAIHRGGAIRTASAAAAFAPPFSSEAAQAASPT